jgi:hypothetical protein
MYQTADQSTAHLSIPKNITTINYTLEWPHLENPSNTTFVGSTQIDICRCPRPDLPPQDDKEPGHIYTRYQCVGPEVHFKAPEEDLWVLQAPRGAINMLRPATREERARREDIHDGTNPAVYENQNFIFLTGPCPRGRYQAYATLKWLESLSEAARQHVSYLSLLVQPYEEDCSSEISNLAYLELIEYILRCLPGFKTLCLDISHENMDLWKAACEFGVLLHRDSVKIVMGCSWKEDKAEEYNSVGTFLEAMGVITDTRFRNGLGGNAEERASDEDDQREDKNEIPKDLESKELATPMVVEDESPDEDWAHATLSPVSPLDGEDRNWQIL